MVGWLSVLLLAPFFLSCQTLREISELRKVDFSIERVTDAYLAGIDLKEVRSYEDLRVAHAAKLGRAVAREELPLRFDLHLGARNPEENLVAARLVEMEWTLFIEGRETISGLLEERVVIPPGEVRSIAVPVSLDLLRFFQENARDLAELAMGVAGWGGKPTEIMIKASPTVQTSLGPIRYARPITIVRQEVGGDPAR